MKKLNGSAFLVTLAAFSFACASPIPRDYSAGMKAFGATMAQGMNICALSSRDITLLSQAYFKDNQKWPQTKDALKIYWSEVLREKIPFEWDLYRNVKFSPAPDGKAMVEYKFFEESNTGGSKSKTEWTCTSDLAIPGADVK